MNQRPHGVTEDLGAEIGYTATAALVDWFGGGNLHVPMEATEDHPIAKVIGMSAFRLLVKWVDTQAATSKDRLLWIPLGYEREQARRDRMISVLFILGLGEKQIASIACMSERHVKAVRQRMEQTGMLPLILRKAGVKALRKGRPGKSD